MPLTAQPLAASPQLQRAAQNNPALKQGSRGEGVATLQQVLSDLGYRLPVSMTSGHPDGEYGSETTKAVYLFQSDNQLSRDGAAGDQTLHRLNAIVSVGWFAEQLKLLAAFVYAVEYLLRSPSFAFQHPALALELRRECQKMREILRRYGKSPSAEENPFQQVAATGLLMIGGGVVIAFGMLMIYNTAVSKLPPQEAPRIPDFKLPKVDAITTTGIMAGALLILKISVEAAKKTARDIESRLRRCLERGLSEMCTKAVKIVLKLAAKVLQLAWSVEAAMRTDPRRAGSWRNVPKELVKEFESAVKLLEEAAKGVSDTGCCPA